VTLPEAPTEDSYFRYTLEGLTDNGVFVLQTAEWTGGTGTFYSLLFVRIIEGVGFGDETKGTLTLDHKRLLIEKLGEIPLGDRTNPIITVKGNEVHIETEQFPSGETVTKNIKISLGK
jgi:hypothetical protein